MAGTKYGIVAGYDGPPGAAQALRWAARARGGGLRTRRRCVRRVSTRADRRRSNSSAGARSRQDTRVTRVGVARVGQPAGLGDVAEGSQG
jgi:hypothetical protein